MHIENVHIHVGGLPAFTSAALASIMEFESTWKAPARPPRAGSKPPRISEYWEGEGGVYVGVRPGVDGPDRHIILPIDARFVAAAKRAIGTYEIDVIGARSDHDGMANTIAYAKAGSELCEEILEMEVEGHKDLYLMARAEARLCMANVPQLFKKEWHLTSTQYSAGNAWGQDFYYGYQNYDYKKFEALFRPVRSLIL